MLRPSQLAVLALLCFCLPLVLATQAAAADKEVKGKVVKVDAKKMTIVISTEDGNKTYTINEETKFLGPRGGVSEAGIKDDRLKRGAEVTLIIAGNNRTVREVHLPVRKSDQ
jgi:Protein of unknown function (DUF1344)